MGNEPPELARGFDGVIRLSGGRGQCLRCGKISSTYGNANKHYKFMHGPRRRIKCPLCGQVAVNEAYFERHLRESHKIKRSQLKEAVIPNSS